MMKSLPCVNARIKHWTKSITKYPFSNTIIAKCHFVSSILPFSTTWMYSYQYFQSCALTNPHNKNTNTHTPKCTNSAEPFTNISIPLFTVCLRLNH